MGSGTNRAYWSKFGSRTSRRRGTKSTRRDQKTNMIASLGARLSIKAARAEAARRSNGRAA